MFVLPMLKACYVFPTLRTVHQPKRTACAFSKSDTYPPFTSLYLSLALPISLALTLIWRRCNDRCTKKQTVFRHTPHPELYFVKNSLRSLSQKHIGLLPNPQCSNKVFECIAKVKKIYILRAQTYKIC